MIIKCLHCSKEFSRSGGKYCSRSCAASRIGRLKPKRVRKITFCKRCKTGACNKRQTVCLACRENTLNTTLAELRDRRSHQKNTHVRDHARRVYRKSNRPRKCIICQYDLHYEVCHKKAIESFPLTATLAEVNNIDNLVALCRNHHWEFDNGHLSLPLVGFEPT